MRRRRALPLIFLLLPAPPIPADEALTPDVVVSAENCDEHDPQAAYNSLRDEYLVVWNDFCTATTPAARVLARRVDRYGRPLAPTFELAPTADGHNRTRPSVAYDATHDRYLAVYAYDYWNDGSDLDIRGRFIAWNGVEPTWSEFMIASTERMEWNPVVAFSSVSGSFLVAFSKSDASAGIVVWGALFGFGATPSPFPIASPGLRVSPDVAYDAFWNLFTVSYDDSNDVFARTIDAATGVIAPEVPVGTDASIEALSAVASCDNWQSIVIWQFLFGPGDYDLVGRFLYGSGGVDGLSFPVSASSVIEGAGEVACLEGGLDYLAVFEADFVAGIFGIAGRRIDVFKQQRPPFDLRRPIGGETGYAEAPAVAGGHSGWLVVWQQQREPPEVGYMDIHTRVVWSLFADGFEWGNTASWSAVSP